METKKWIPYGWQTFLLCVVVSVSSPVLAKSSPPSSSKDNARKAKTAKPQPVTLAVSSKPTSSRSANPRQNTRKEQLSIVNHQQQKVKGKPSTRQEKIVPPLLLLKPRKKDAPLPQPALTRIPYPRLEKLRPSESTVRQTAPMVSGRIKQRYITVLKETKRQRMEKVVIEIPQSRAATRFKQWGSSETKTRQKSFQPTRQADRLLAITTRKSKARLSPQVLLKSVPVVTATASLPANTNHAEPVEPSSVVSPSPLPSPVTKDSAQQDKSQVGTPVGTATPEPPRSEAAATPTSPAPTTVALVEPSSPSSGGGAKDEPRQKDWSGYSPQKAPFAATVNDEPLGYRINSLFVLPGDEIFLAVVDAQKRADYSIRSTLGPERLLASRRWYWTAPTTTGLYQIKITNTRSNSAITLNVFVMVPLDRIEEDGHLNGYRIGTYPTEPLRQLAMYNRPRGLIEVTSENENTQVSPHFRLRQFLCKQDGGYPKYMILDARLLTTLEHLLEMVNARGYRARTFSIMSGYRTPYYNRAIGNRTTYSRHLWGDAADIFIDEEPKDGKMDDLNQDGVIDAHDADVIYQLIESAAEPRIQKIMLGGLARYRETSSHGPFIHVDARGSYARWGLKTLTKGGTTPNETGFPTNNKSTLPSFWDGKSPGEDLR